MSTGRQHKLVGVQDALGALNITAIRTELSSFSSSLKTTNLFNVRLHNLGIWFGVEPSTSQSGNRFMGTGMLNTEGALVKLVIIDEAADACTI